MTYQPPGAQPPQPPAYGHQGASAPSASMRSHKFSDAPVNPWIRILAGWLDSIPATLGLLPAMIAEFIGLSTGSIGAGYFILWALTLIFLLGYLGLLFGLLGSTGSSPGSAITGYRIRALDNTALSWSRAALRTLAMILLWLLTCGLGPLVIAASILVSRDARGLLDILASSRAVSVRGRAPITASVPSNSPLTPPSHPQAAKPGAGPSVATDVQPAHTPIARPEGPDAREAAANARAPFPGAHPSTVGSRGSAPGTRASTPSGHEALSESPLPTAHATGVMSLDDVRSSDHHRELLAHHSAPSSARAARAAREADDAEQPTQVVPLVEPTTAMVVTFDTGARHRLTPGTWYVIGRHPITGPGELPLPFLDDSRSLSKTHARIRVQGSGIDIADAGSTNGTRIQAPDGSERTLSPHAVSYAHIGSRIYLGERWARLETIDA